MKILIVRHADPIYENDTLTEHGWHEAEVSHLYAKGERPTRCITDECFGDSGEDKTPQV